MTRAMIGLWVGTLVVAGCGDEDDCAAACKKIVECKTSTTSLAQCASECAADPGNAELARCYAALPGCDETSVKTCDSAQSSTHCNQAVAKINACMTANGSTSSSVLYSGWCSDQANVASGKKIAFLSWSKAYLACTVDPKTCHCPGQTWYTDL